MEILTQLIIGVLIGIFVTLFLLGLLFFKTIRDLNSEMRSGTNLKQYKPLKGWDSIVRRGSASNRNILRNISNKPKIPKEQSTNGSS